jgi:hypothetical protein
VLSHRHRHAGLRGAHDVTGPLDARSKAFAQGRKRRTPGRLDKPPVKLQSVRNRRSRPPSRHSATKVSRSRWDVAQVVVGHEWRRQFAVGCGWRANLERAKAFVSATVFPVLTKLLAAGQFPTARLIRCRGTPAPMGDAGGASAALQGAGSANQRGEPGPVATQILKKSRQILGDARVDDDIARVGCAGSAPDIAPAVLFLYSMDLRRQFASQREPRSLDRRDETRVLIQPRRRII